MREHVQFSARVLYQNILLTVVEIHLKFNTHSNLCRTCSSPSKPNSVPLWSFSSFPKDTGEPDVLLHLP